METAALSIGETALYLSHSCHWSLSEPPDNVLDGSLKLDMKMLTLLFGVFQLFPKGRFFRKNYFVKNNHE